MTRAAKLPPPRSRNAPQVPAPRRRAGAHHVGCWRELSARRAARGRDGAAAVGAGAVLVPGGAAAQLRSLHPRHPAFAARLRPAADCKAEEPARLRQDFRDAVDVSEARRDLRARDHGARALQARPDRRASDHHRRDLQPVAVLGGDGGARGFGRADPLSAARLLRLSRRGVLRRDGGGVEPARRRPRRHARKLLSRQLGVRDSDPDPLGAERHADRALVRRLRGIGRHRRQLRRAGGGADSVHELRVGGAGRAQSRSGAGDPADDVRHHRRSLDRARVLSGRADRDGRRQRLCHDVLPAVPGADRAGVAAAVVGDSRPQVPRQRDLPDRAGADRRGAPLLHLQVLARGAARGEPPRAAPRFANIKA